MMHEITSLEALDEALGAAPVVALYVSSPTCTACDALRPKLEALLTRHALPACSVDVAVLPGIAAARSILASPTLALFVDGSEVRKWSGFLSIPEIDEALTRIARLRAGTRDPG